MTKEEILKMEAGSEIDALFAEKVMGWKKGPYIWCDNALLWWEKEKSQARYDVDEFHPSTNISHAMEGVEIAKKEHWYFQIHNAAFDSQWKAMLWWSGHLEVEPIATYAQTAPLAITRALILWAMED